MFYRCFWEHNGDDTLLYSTEYLGAYTRGASLDIAKQKMFDEIRSFVLWSEQPFNDIYTGIEIAEEKLSDLNICDADSDAIFNCETLPMDLQEYKKLKNLALKSAEDFLLLYKSIPDKEKICLPARKTFYGLTPRSATEMYNHTKNVNDYYFGEINVDCDNEGDIVSCRKRGFDLLEQQTDFLQNKTFIGNYDEIWTVKKVLRRFIWHDRIHAKAMYRMAIKTFGRDSVPNIFLFNSI